MASSGIAPESSQHGAASWIIFVNSKEFEQLADDTFHETYASKSCVSPHVQIERIIMQHHPPHASASSSHAPALEQGDAIHAAHKLYDKLTKLCKRRLPKPPSARKIMQHFDVDQNDVLDLLEFRRFARIYFSKIKWPVWRLVVQGCFSGISAILVYNKLLRPVVVKLVNVLLPTVVGKVVATQQRRFENIVSRQWKTMKIRFGDGNPFLSEDEFRELQSLDDEERSVRLRHVVRKYIVAASMGTALQLVIYR
eukprot:gene7748-9212_t